MDTKYNYIYVYSQTARKSNKCIYYLKSACFSSYNNFLTYRLSVCKYKSTLTAKGIHQLLKHIFILAFFSCKSPSPEELGSAEVAHSKSLNSPHTTEHTKLHFWHACSIS